MPKTRFAIPKKFGASEVTLFDSEEFDVKDHVTIPVNGIPGLAGYGFVALLEAQLVGGPKTPKYVADTAANLCVYLTQAWKPGDSAGIMRRNFQLVRALTENFNKKNNKKPPTTFARILPQVLAYDDRTKQALWNEPVIQGITSEWNVAKGEHKPAVDVSATLKGVVG